MVKLLCCVSSSLRMGVRYSMPIAEVKVVERVSARGVDDPEISRKLLPLGVVGLFLQLGQRIFDLLGRTSMFLNIEVPLSQLFLSNIAHTARKLGAPPSPLDVGV